MEKVFKMVIVAILGLASVYFAAKNRYDVATYLLVAAKWNWDDIDS